MKKYTYKDSDVEWLGAIPEHWKVTKIKKEFKVQPSNVNKKSKENEDEVLLCNYVDVYYNNYITNDIDFMSTATASENEIKKFKLKIGDVIITKDSEDPFDIAVPSLVKEIQDKLLCGYHLSMLRSIRNKIEGSFLFWSLNNEFIASQLYREATGVTRWAIASRHVKNSSFTYPPPQEQKSIAEYLDKVTAKLDRIIAIKQEQLVKMGDYYDSKIHEYITKGNNNTKLIASGIDWQGEVPYNWKKEKLFRLADKMGSGGTPKSTNQDYYGGEIDWIQSGDLNDWIVSTTKKTITEEALNNSSAKMFKKGTLLIAMYGATIGKLGVMDMDAATNQACCAIQVGSKLNSDFLFYLLYDMRKYLISQGYGGGQPNISQETLKQQYFYYPAKTEQIEIVNQIKDFRSKQEIIRDNIKSQIKTLQAYRKSLIHECVTGKKQVTAIHQSNQKTVNI